MVAAREFREDLFFRLSVIEISIPPLRARRDDILPLAESFLEKFSRDAGRRRPLTLSPESIRALSEHAWPGNVRELQNGIERAVILCSGDVVEPEHLRIDAQASPRPKMGDVIDLSGSISEVRDRAGGRRRGGDGGACARPLRTARWRTPRPPWASPPTRSGSD